MFVGTVQWYTAPILKRVRRQRSEENWPGHMSLSVFPTTPWRFDAHSRRTRTRRQPALKKHTQHHGIFSQTALSCLSIGVIGRSLL